MSNTNEESEKIAESVEKMLKEGKAAEFVGYIPQEETLEQALFWMGMVGIDCVVSEEWKYGDRPSKKVRVIVLLEDF